MSLRTEDMAEQWRIESIGGGIVGTRREVEHWAEAWAEEYGDKYPISVQRRYVSAWEDASLEAPGD